MKMKRTVQGTVTLAVLLFLVVIGWRPDLVLAQATAGYTKVNTAPITALTFTTTSLAPGTYNFEVTAVNLGGESLPSNIVTGVATTAAPHATITWTVPAIDATHGAAISYNVYDQMVTPANPPGATSLTWN